MSDYTPTTDAVRINYASSMSAHNSAHEPYAAFNRWLKQYDRDVAAKALEDAADELTPGDDKVDDWGIQAGLLRDRAQAIRGGDL